MHHGNRSETSQLPETTAGRSAVTAARGAARLRRVVGAAGGAVLLTALLAACGLVPPQEISNPFGLDGTPVAVHFPGDTASLAPQAVTGSASGDFEFDDYDASLPVSPGSIQNEIRFASAVLDDPEGPASITLTSAVLTVRVWQGAADFGSAEPSDRSQFALDMNGSLTLTRGACTATGCNYDVEGATLGTLRAQGAALSSLLNVATNAPTPNQGQASLEVVAEEDELAGSTLLIILDASQGSVRL